MESHGNVLIKSQLYFIISWCKPQTIHTAVQAKSSVGGFCFKKSACCSKEDS